MKVLIDTSVLVSAILPDHVHYPQSRPWIERAKVGAFELVIASHSLVETYSVLTRLPRRPRIKPAEAFQLIQQNVSPHATIVALSGDDYVKLITELSRTGITGGRSLRRRDCDSRQTERCRSVVDLERRSFSTCLGKRSRPYCNTAGARSPLMHSELQMSRCPPPVR